MSTNYYLRNKEEYKEMEKAREKISLKIEELLKTIEELVSEENMDKDKIKWSIEGNIELNCEEIHIGKRSGGWKPTFEKQDEFASVKELKSFYEKNQDKYEIVNEYGEVFDWERLVEELITWEPNGKEQMENSYKDKQGYVWHNYKYS